MDELRQKNRPLLVVLYWK